MAKDPAVLFYTSDFLSGTFTMTDEQVGQYIRLLCLQHQKNELSENDMKMICKSHDEVVISKFIKTERNTFYNERMKIESEKRKAFITSRSQNKKGKNKKDMKIISKSCENHMENENENENENKDGVEIENVEILENYPFEDFWILYDKKRGDKVKLSKKWEKISDADRKKIFEYIPQYKLSQPNKEFRKDPETFLNNKSWNDELIYKSGNNGRPGKVSVTERAADNLRAYAQEVYGRKDG